MTLFQNKPIKTWETGAYKGLYPYIVFIAPALALPPFIQLLSYFPIKLLSGHTCPPTVTVMSHIPPQLLLLSGHKFAPHILSGDTSSAHP